MPLVNSLQISQDLGRDAPPTPAVNGDLFKVAGSTQALADLGLIPSEEMEKNAWVGAALSAAGRALPWLWRGAKALGGKLWSAGSGVSNAIAKPIGGLGNRAVQSAGARLGASPATISKIQGLGKGMATEGMGFGLLSGGLEAAMADPGERGQAFMRGFGSGALGGMAWRGAGNVATAGMRRAMPKAFGKMEELAASKSAPWYKRWGSKAVVGGVPFAAGMAASMYTPTFHGEPKTQSPYQQYAPYAARLGAGVTMPQVMGAYPGGYGYNPNLPLPQGGRY